MKVKVACLCFLLCVFVSSLSFRYHFFDLVSFSHTPFYLLRFVFYYSLNTILQF